MPTETHKTRKRVLVLASTFPRWAGDTEPPFVFNLSRSLADRFDITVLAPHAAGAARKEVLGGLNVVRFPYFWPARLQKLAYGGMLPNLKRNPWLWLQVPLFLTAEFFAAWRLVRRERPDVIHAHWVVPQGLVAAALRLATRTPVVITAHGGDVYGARGGIKDSLKRWALGRSDALTAVSGDLARAVAALSAHGAPAVEVISMGVDAGRFAGSGEKNVLKSQMGVAGPLLLFVGRLAEKKGVRYLLDAMPLILARHPNATLLLAGDGPLRAELEAQASALALDPAARFLGAIRPEDLPPYYGAADVFVGPSVVAEGGDVEGLPVSLMEAMASGCPVVATNVGGISELVADGETGILIEQRDPQAIAAAVSRILDGPAVASLLGRRAQARVIAGYAQPFIADRYASVLLKAAA